MIEHSLLAAPQLLLLLLSVICQAQPLTERHIVELEQNTAYPNHSYSIKRGRYTLSGNLSVIAHTNGYTEPDSLPDDKPHKSGGYGVKTPLNEPISWQWLYATSLLVGYQLILTTKDTSLSSIPFSWLPMEVAIIVGWLLKSHGYHNSPFPHRVEQQDVSHPPPICHDHYDDGFRT
ncbi:hypothetical protein [Endozoicomonas sp. ONNA1]|uniref:hypothetical protein n=1 Tax=Endozoicomonas sp. ONNA1 TaxID=2828740 RepID=UPI00214774EA|nr:hypothetical protein [Endozoicomonas sp. ONNA1]